MAELLLELFSEEIPARMQARAADDLKRLVTEGLKAQGLGVGEAEAYATPRRLTRMPPARRNTATVSFNTPGERLPGASGSMAARSR